MNEIIVKPIGIIHTPFKEPKGTPIQPTGARDIEGTVEVFPDYADGLRDLDGFSHLYLLFYCHLSKEHSLLVKPFLGDSLHGVFATRSPSRPNPIGLSIVRLTKIERNLLHIRDVDMVDGTPLLDIKPYIPDVDTREAVRIGWLKKRVGGMSKKRDDGRFYKE